MSKPESDLSAAEMNDRLMRDAGAVIQRRLEIMAEALCDPAGADLTELALMSDEKLAAFTEASGRSAAGAGAVAGRLASAWVAEADIGARALDQAMKAPDAAQAAVIQAQWALGWWGRAAETAMGLNAETARIQAEVLAPVQAAVSANARRLKRD
ncbi:MAG: phasin [Brevundimonas sp.]|uniref:phasin n=1 Tax=Brevundimonas sp. TaxID=1871086 RepID=UPI00391A9E5D